MKVKLRPANEFKGWDITPDGEYYYLGSKDDWSVPKKVVDDQLEVEIRQITGAGPGLLMDAYKEVLLSDFSLVPFYVLSAKSKQDVMDTWPEIFL